MRYLYNIYLESQTLWIPFPAVNSDLVSINIYCRLYWKRKRALYAKGLKCRISITRWRCCIKQRQESNASHFMSLFSTLKRPQYIYLFIVCNSMFIFISFLILKDMQKRFKPTWIFKIKMIINNNELNTYILNTVMVNNVS